MDHVHVRPLDNLIGHDTTGDDCVCGPYAQAVLGDDGSMGWVMVHHSLDGREQTEEPR